MAEPTGRSIGTIIEKGPRKFVVRLYTGTGPDGRRKYHTKTINGKRATAERYLSRLVTGRDEGTLPIGGRGTLADFLDGWLESSVKHGVRKRTAGDYADVVRLYLKPELGALQLRTLQALDVRRVYLGLTERGLSPRTVRKVHAVLHTALEQAVRDKLIVQNVARLAKDARPKAVRAERKVLTPDEATRLVAALDAHENGCYWLTLLTTGIRPEEALALRWTDVLGDRVVVQRVLVERGGVRIEETKTSKSRRTIPLPASTSRALREHRKRQLEKRMKQGEKYEDQGLVFATRSGKPFRQSFLRGQFRTVLTTAKLPEMRQYDLRHSCATLLLAAGENPKVVSERLGHSSVTLTLDTYSHVLPGMQEAATEKLEALVFGNVRNTPATQTARADERAEQRPA